MGLVAIEFLYGLFLFAVMSTGKNHRADATDGTELYAEATPAEPRFVPKPEAVPVPSTPASPEQDQPQIAKKIEEETPKPLASDTQAAAPKVVKNEKPEDSTPEKVRGKEDEDKAVAAAIPEPPPTKPDVVVAKPPTTLPPLGALIDPIGDSKASLADGIFTIGVAAGPHIFDPLREIVDAPRALTEIDGDFTAEVKVLGDFRPGTVPLKGLFFTFQGAGLLVWHDKDNFVRFERAAAYTGDQLQWIYLESCKDGKPSKPTNIKVRNGAVTLRLERRGNAINYTYSFDGKTWLKADHIATTLPSKVSIGISANNVSPRPFSARFTDFVLKPDS